MNEAENADISIVMASISNEVQGKKKLKLGTDNFVPVLTTNVSISGTGHYVPSNIVTNSDLENMVTNYDVVKAGKSLDEWYRTYYGIRERRRGGKNESPSDMAVTAAKAAINDAKLNVADVDFLVLNTAFGDYQQPTTATEVQKKLGMREDTFAMEVNLSLIHI